MLVSALTMDRIQIDETKSIGLLFQPRCGSHVVAHYLATQTNRGNLGELFNARLSINFSTEVKLRQLIPTIIDGGKPFLDHESDLVKREILNLRVGLIESLIHSNRQEVFKIYPNSYLTFYPELSARLKQCKHVQYILLARADVLYSMISAVISSTSDTFHNFNAKRVTHDVNNLVIPRELITIAVNNYIMQADHIAKYFGEVPVVYYEQFQDNVQNLRKIFSGIPAEIISIPYNKFSGNHKSLIQNLDEVEYWFNEIVMNHQEYFPQYFGKLPHIKIPARQGNQPSCVQ